jgi:hypothetical protein
MQSYSSEDRQPLFWWREHPIHTALAIVLFYCATMLVTTACMFLRVDHVLFEWLSFDSAAVWRGQVWRFATYGLVNPPSLWFVIDMFMLAWFGRDLERFFGRGVFVKFYVCLYLLTPLVFTVLGLWRPMYLVGQTGAFAMFIAFATLYPNVAMFFNLLAKWVVAILVAIYTLMHLASRDVASLVSLWSTVAFAFCFVRYEQGGLTLPRFTRAAKAAAPERVVAPPKAAELDQLLDKIARSGLHSLTPGERVRLEQLSHEANRRRGRG